MELDTTLPFEMSRELWPKLLLPATVAERRVPVTSHPLLSLPLALANKEKTPPPPLPNQILSDQKLDAPAWLALSQAWTGSLYS
jgi:hypothetical protein